MNTTYNFAAIADHPAYEQICAEIVSGSKLRFCGGRRRLSQSHIANFLRDNPHHPEASASALQAKIDAAWEDVQKKGVTFWQSQDGKKSRYYLNGSDATGDAFESAFYDVEAGAYCGNNESLVSRLKAIIAPYLELKASLAV